VGRFPRIKVKQAARVIAAGGVVAYPTEAVFGLGCDPWNRAAVERLLAIKRRRLSKGLILIAENFAQLEAFVAPLAPERMAQIQATWPGAVTWLLPARETTPQWLTGRHPTLAVRVTAHPLAAALCRACGSALVSTSANLSTRPPARTDLQVRLRLGGTVDFILAGATGPQRNPTQIRDARTGKIIRR
jgi:L-threonylcarbamoyladenylate synthase